MANSTDDIVQFIIKWQMPKGDDEEREGEKKTE